MNAGVYQDNTVSPAMMAQLSELKKLDAAYGIL
jgi:hypothetical protein